MFGCTPKVDLKYNSLEKWREERPPKKGSRYERPTMMENVALRKPYSTYHSLLSEHYKSRPSPPPKDPIPDPDPIPF